MAHSVRAYGDALDLFVQRRNAELYKKGLILIVDRWEHFLDAISITRLQDEYNQAVRNSQDGISLFQTAEGAMDEVHSMLQRARELMVQAGNGTLSTGDLGSIDAELKQLGGAIDRIANTTIFNGLYLLNGSFNGGNPPNGNPLTLQVGPNANTINAHPR